MKFSRYPFQIGALILSVLLSAQLQAECQNKELVNGWGGVWTPFIMGTANKPGGLDMDILDAVVKKAGCTWRNTPQSIPWTRHLKMIELGRLDIATAASWTEERAKYAYFTDAYRTEHVGIYVLEENVERFSKLSLNDLLKQDFELGTQMGNVYGEVMTKAMANMTGRVHEVEGNEQNIEKLLLKRIDGYIGFPPYDSILINHRKRSAKIVLLPNTLIATGKVHFMLSKEAHPSETFESLNQALKALKEEGAIQKIKQNYSKRFGTDFY